ncbi:MAG: AI-2E family transporter [Bacteroidota bacterium]|nr:AI-2E family transporter [Bacteroidota bacterium]
MQLTPLVRSVLQLLVLAAIAWLAFTVRSIFIYVGIAMILTFLGKPLVNLLAGKNRVKWRMPMWLAALITLVVMVSTFVGLQAILLPRFVKEMTILSKINFKELGSTLQEEIESVQRFIQDLPFSGREAINLEESVFSIINMNTVTNTFEGLAGGLGNLAIAIFSILFILFFLLKEDKLSEKLIKGLVRNKNLEHWHHIIPRVKNTLSRYFIAISIQITVIFTTVFIGLNIIGLENVVVIALFAALINVIPYLGPIFGMAFGLFLGIGQAYALGTSENLLELGGQILIVFACVQLIDNFITQPVVFSNSINATPLEIFLVISIAGTLGGIPGMVVAVPAYSVIRIFADEFYGDNQWVRFVLGPKK